MSQSELLAHLSILDGEISKIEGEKATIQKDQEAARIKLAASEKKLLALQSSLDAAEKELKTNKALIDNEQKQFSQRERQLMDMGGAKSAKHLGSENDRATLVIQDLEKKVGANKEAVSQAETAYLKFEELVSTERSQFELRKKDNAQRLSQLGARKDQLDSDRNPKVKMLAPEIAPTYDKLRQKVADPVTTIDDGSCATCYSAISPRIMNSIKSGTPEVCPGCHRLIVGSLVIGESTESQELI
jgi:predicted  nucleic acid-binding Zn-ribbon protein